MAKLVCYRNIPTGTGSNQVNPSTSGDTDELPLRETEENKKIKVGFKRIHYFYNCIFFSTK